MAEQFKALVREIEIAFEEGNVVTIIIAAGPIKLTHASTHDDDENLLSGTNIQGRSVLIHGSAILAAYIDDPDGDF